MVAITLRADLSRGLTNAEIDANFSNLKTAVEAAALSAAWANLTGKPTTLSGYGITDAQAALVSGTNIKTFNGTSLLGSGNIQLGSSDVTGALGFTPYNATNPSGFISGITGAMVTTALGFTPYNNTNPSGYISGITSGMVTTALGFTPYNSSNPNGYVSSVNKLSGFADATIYSVLAPASTLNGPQIRLKYSGGTTDRWIDFGWQDNAGTFVSGLKLLDAGSLTFQGNAVLTAGNYASYAPTFLGNYERSTNARVTGSTAGAMGLLGVDSTSAFRFQIYGDGTNFGFLSSVWGAWSLKGDAAGNWIATSNITAYSDESLKKDWLDLPDNFVELLAQVKHGTYTRIDTGERQIGVGARSLLGVAPEGVMGGEFLSVAYGNVALASAVELAKRVVKLEEQLNKLIGE